MTQILVQSLGYSMIRPEILEDCAGRLIETGYSKKSADYKRLITDTKTSVFAVFLLATSSFFSALTPWVWHYNEISSEKELSFYMDNCPTFQFTNKLRIFWLNKDDEVARTLVAKAVKMTAKNLKVLNLTLNSEACLTEELEAMLWDANRALPFLENFSAHNTTSIANKKAGRPSTPGNGYITNRDVEVYLSIIKSPSLALSINGRKLKMIACDFLEKHITGIDRHRKPAFKELFFFTGDRSWKTTNTPSKSFVLSPTTTTTTKTTSTKNRVGFDFVFVIKDAMDNQKLNFELLANYLVLLTRCCDTSYQHSYPGAIVPAESPNLYSDPASVQWILSKYLDIYEYVLADYKHDPSQMGFFLHTIVDATTSLSLCAISSKETRRLIVEEYSTSLLTMICDVMNLLLQDKEDLDKIKHLLPFNRRSTHAVDITVFSLIGVFITLCGEDEHDPSTLSFRQKACRVIPASLLARCLENYRIPKLLRYAVKYLNAGLRYQAVTPTEVIFSSDKLMKNIKTLLEESDLHPYDQSALLADLACKSVAFDFSKHPSARAGQLKTFAFFESNPDWMVTNVKKLQDSGMLAACFQHLKNFTPNISADLARDPTIQSSEMFSFYAIDACIFAEGVTAEAKRCLKKFDEDVAKNANNNNNNKKAWYDEFDNDDAQTTCQPSAAVKYIQENIYDAVEILERFKLLAPPHFQTYAGLRFEACICAVIGGEAGLTRRYKAFPKKFVVPSSATIPTSFGFGSSTTTSTTTFGFGTQSSSTATTATTTWGSKPATSWGSNSGFGGWGAKSTTSDITNNNNNNSTSTSTATPAANNAAPAANDSTTTTTTTTTSNFGGWGSSAPATTTWNTSWPTSSKK